MGFGTTLTKSYFGKANQKRNYKILEEFAYVLIEEARHSCYKNDFEIKIDGNVYAFNSSTIDLYLSIFWWAEFRKKKSGIKLHTLYDVKTSIPCFMLITTARIRDVNVLDNLQYYILDRGYVDFSRLHNIHLHKAYFVTLANSNFKIYVYIQMLLIKPSECYVIK